LATKTNVASEPSHERNKLNRAGVLTLVGVLVVMALAFFLRIFLLDGQSLWYDEGITMVMVPRDLITLTQNASSDIHPPMYYYFLHFWTGLVGTSEFGGRFLSVIYGVLLIPLIFQLTRRLFGKPAGISAAIFAAMAPFLVYYSQEARMYMQLTFFGALSTFLYVKLVVEDHNQSERIRKLLWAAYWLASTITIYSQYFGITVLLFQNLHFWLISGRQKSSWKSWLIAEVAIAISFAPWLPVLFSQFGAWPSISEPFGLDWLLRNVFIIFTLGLSWDASATPTRELVPMALLAAALIYVLLSKKRLSWQNLFLVAAYALVPVLLMYGLSLRRPMYNPKFLLIATPAYYCLLGVGVAGLGKIIQTALAQIRIAKTAVVSIGLAAIVAIAGIGGLAYADYFSLNAYYFDQKYQRDNYRGLVQYVNERSRPGDVIVLNAPGQVEIFDYYYRGASPRVPLPARRPINEAQTQQQLADLAAKHQRVWLVLWAQSESDPHGVIEGWLDQHTFKGMNNWFGSIRLCLYKTSPTADLIETKTSTRFGDNITLSGYSYESTSTVPGESVPLTLKWTSSQILKNRYSVFVHLLDNNNLIVGQRDSEPGGGARPTTTWTVGETIEDRYAIPVQPGTPPGTYQVEIGLYDSQTGQRLPVKNEAGKDIDDRFTFGPITVDHASTKVDPGLLGFKTPSNALFDEKLRLLGFTLQALGRDGDGVNFASSDILHTSLFWSANSTPLGNYAIELQLRKASDNSIAATIKNPPAADGYPTTEWLRDEAIRDQHKLPLKGLSGEYTVWLALRSTRSNETLKVEQATNTNGYIQLGSIKVIP
jgi:uncharacterized membrane protein